MCVSIASRGDSSLVDQWMTELLNLLSILSITQPMLHYHHSLLLAMAGKPEEARKTFLRFCDELVILSLFDVHTVVYMCIYMYIHTSAMHNIIGSEQSGVECACACVLRVVQTFVVAYFELRRTLRYVQHP